MKPGPPPSGLTMRPVARAFFARPVIEVARDMIGCLLVHDTDDGLVAGRIVETEAYGLDDPGSHAAPGPTPRNAPMFEAPGRAYVYFTYGMHWCFNAVTDRTGIPGAVLIRAAEPLEGLELMAARRAAGPKAAAKPVPLRDLARGPARLAQAFGIGPEHNRADLTRPPLFVAMGERYPDDVVLNSPRVGLGSRQDGRRWRYTLKGSPFVSSSRVSRSD